MHLQSSYMNFQASMSGSFGAPGMGGGPQMVHLLQQMVSIMQQQLGMGARGGYGPAPNRPYFGQPRGCGPSFQNPGLGGFCGGNNVNINLPNCPSNVNINLNPGQGGPCGPHGQMCGGRNGQLQQEGKGKPITYTTRGGYKVTVNKHDISIKDPNGNEVKHHGDPHENLNGKHLKDWEGKQRSVVLGDGTKITMSADGPQGVTQHTSIYDGGQNVQIANGQNLVEHQSFNGLDTLMREFAQHDGETAAFTTNYQGDAMYYNMYNQADNGMVTRNFDWLGQAQAGGPVHDLYDDPRLKNT